MNNELERYQKARMAWLDKPQSDVARNLEEAQNAFNMAVAKALTVKKADPAVVPKK